MNIDALEYAEFFFSSAKKLENSVESYEAVNYKY